MTESSTPVINPNLSDPQFSAQKVCANCKYWQSQVKTCHRYPPVTYYTEGGIELSKFPLAKVGDWCGEHQFQVHVQDQFVVKQTFNLP